MIAHTFDNQVCACGSRHHAPSVARRPTKPPPEPDLTPLCLYFIERAKLLARGRRDRFVRLEDLLQVGRAVEANSSFWREGLG